MKQMNRYSIILFLSFLLVYTSQAQQQLTCRISDAQSSVALPGVTIYDSISQRGTVTNSEGIFTISLTQPETILRLSAVGYITRHIRYSLTEESRDTLQLHRAVIGLHGIQVIAGIARDRETPVAVTTIPSRQLEQLGDREFPEVMNRTPGVYATRTGGGSGDARLTLRGFQQENVAVMLNGIPVSSVENGLVYWSNWAGLSEATQSIEIQRGLGSSPLAVNSVGGTINLITNGAGATRGGSIKQSFTSYGNKRTTFAFNTGMIKDSWSVSFIGSRTKGPGYIDATNVDAWSYLLSASKQLSAKHRLTLSLMGSPERHGQRFFGLTQAEYEKYGNRYNSNWGTFNGEKLNLNENFYHKPHISMNHYWDISAKTFLATSVYYSYGYGGGRFTENFQGAPAWSYTKNNQIDWDAIWQNNATHNDYHLTPDGDTLRGYSKVILTNYLASHYWTGILTKLTHQFTPHLNFSAGLHGRIFRSHLREEVDNLMGGQYWIEDYAWATEGVAGRSMIKKPGDIIRVNNYANVDYINSYAQLEYHKNKINLFAGVGATEQWYSREDPYNYPTHKKSKTVTQTGYDARAGASWRINASHHLFANAGYYSRPPYHKFVFVNFSNAVARNLTNETIQSAEFGYGYRHGSISASVNAYYTLWKDKSLLSYENIQLQDNKQTRALVRGLDALHQGVEMEMQWNPSIPLQLGMAGTIGLWQWQNDVEAELYDDNQTLAGITKVYADDLYVGDAPQTTLAAWGEYQLCNQLGVSVEWNYFDRLYANFDPASRNNPDDRKQPYMMPAYSMWNSHITYRFALAKKPAEAVMSIFNIGDTENMMRGDDGPNHNRETIRAFRTFGRTFNFSLKIAF